MNMSDFCVPFTFPVAASSHPEGGVKDGGNHLERSLANSRPTSIEYWNGEIYLDSQAVGSSGIILGCQDGSIYVLSPPVAPYKPTIRKQHNSHADSDNDFKITSFNSSTSSFSPALTITSPTFHFTAKPRIVSGITAVPVEAPKNYVDFEDEPDKLKDILKGRNPKDRRPVMEAPSGKSSKSATPPVSPTRSQSGIPRYAFSSTNSRASSPVVSTPDSPHESTGPSRYPWAMLYHIIASTNILNNPVRALKVFGNNKYFAALHANGILHIYLTQDGLRISSLRIREHSKLQGTWTWLDLSVLSIDGCIVIVVVGEKDNLTPSLTQGSEDMALQSASCIFIEFTQAPSNSKLLVLRQVHVDSPADGIIVKAGINTIMLMFVSIGGNLLQREFPLRSTPSSHEPQESYPNSSHSSGSHLAVPNIFKSVMSRSSEQLVAEEHKSLLYESFLNEGFSEARDFGFLQSGLAPLGMRCFMLEGHGSFLGGTWTQEELLLFQHTGQSTRVFLRSPIAKIKCITWLTQSVYVLHFERHIEIHRVKYVDESNDEVDCYLIHDPPLQALTEQIGRIDIREHEAIKFNHTRSIIYVEFAEDKQQVLLLNLESESLRPSKLGACILWSSEVLSRNNSEVYPTSLLPLDHETVAQGHSDGYLRQFSLSQLSIQKEDTDNSKTISPIKVSDHPLNGHVIALHTVRNYRTRDVFIAGGGDDGSIAFWNVSTFELAARWTIFATPLVCVIQLEEEKIGTLRGCVLCVSEDGSIAVIVVDGFHLLYLIPGSVAPLARICIGGNNLLLLYSDHRARLWDAQTKELWRSMAQDKALDMLGQGGWAELSLEEIMSVPKLYWTAFNQSPYALDAVSSLNLNLEKFIVNAIAVTKTISSSKDDVRNILLTLDRLRLILSALLTPGLNDDVDSICYGKLGLHRSSTAVGLASNENVILYGARTPQEVWCVSGIVTASRMLAIVSVLRTMSLFEELTEGANTVISFFTISLRQSVGHRYMSPDLEYLGKLWFYASTELRLSIKLILEATIASLSDEESNLIAEKWQHHVPSLQPDSEKETTSAALALLICGYIAAEKYSLLSINALMDISKSISLYLHDEKLIFRVLAIDLCSRGFNVWQHYVDAMEILRSLFSLATSVRKDTISIQNVGAQARLAVLTIASDNMPLFMGTLCLDILTPPSMEHRRSVLQVLAFLIRKRPHVLQPNLPRLMEAVVKSLDPNSTADRDLVLDTATEIIGHVVKTFPTVDFHMASQRLAVGTNEGAVVMYDLKTAIRLYVLEGHKRAITALSFSPDGRRLVTMSLKESLVLAWKVGSSFASFFNPGAPPRQGSGGSQSFKSLNFNIGSEGEMTTAESIDLVSIEWVGERTVKVKIRQSVLTFGT